MAGRIPVGGALAPIAGGAAAAVAVFLGGFAGISGPVDVGRELASPVVAGPDGEPIDPVVPQGRSAGSREERSTDEPETDDGRRTPLQPSSEQPEPDDQPGRRQPPATEDPPTDGSSPPEPGSPPGTTPDSPPPPGPPGPGVQHPPPPPPSPPGNAAPVANDDSFSVLEDSGTTGFDVLANDVDSDLDPATVSVVSAPSRGTATPSGGSIRYRPSADANGGDGFTYRVCDVHGACAIASVSVSVTAVNDAPSFRAGPSLVVSLLNRSQTRPGWASDIRVGPPDESGQRVSFQVTNNRNSMFRRQPAIAANGDLTFEVAPLALGTATVTVVMTDDGGGRTAVSTPPPRSPSPSWSSPPDERKRKSATMPLTCTFAATLVVRRWLWSSAHQVARRSCRSLEGRRGGLSAATQGERGIRNGG